MKDYTTKQLIVFDLDGTLTESKSPMQPDMAKAIAKLLATRKVAVISGGMYKQFKKQFIGQLHAPKELLQNLLLFPTTATAFYRYQNGWKKVYAFTLTKREDHAIRQAFAEVLKEIHYVHPKKTYGKVIENRGSQITFSALGQDVVAKLGKKGIELKDKWKRENTSLKLKIAKMVQKRLPGLEVRAAAYTSIDVTRKGIDKAYGVRKIKSVLKMPIRNMLFVGDGLYPGGNDQAARSRAFNASPLQAPRIPGGLSSKSLRNRSFFDTFQLQRMPM